MIAQADGLPEVILVVKMCTEERGLTMTELVYLALVEELVSYYKMEDKPNKKIERFEKLFKSTD